MNLITSLSLVRVTVSLRQCLESPTRGPPPCVDPGTRRTPEGVSVHSPTSLLDTSGKCRPELLSREILPTERKRVGSEVPRSEQATTDVYTFLCEKGPLM